jgi:osmotically-inducible protein OsmY
MKTDSQIQQDVMEQLKWEPFLNAAQIGVAVKNGIVTLSGQVDSYAKKLAAENATKKIVGVKAVAEDIQIGVSPLNSKTDSEIAEAVYNALKWHTAVQEEKIKIKVENGNVKLEGEVDWEYQRKNAQAAIENLIGVRAVVNLIMISRKVIPSDVKQKISSALTRSAILDAGKINVEVIDNKVVLRGIVRSYAEKQDAENAAWSALGVTCVDDRIEMEMPEFAFD